MTEPRIAAMDSIDEGGLLARLTGEMDLDAALLEMVVRYEREARDWPYDEPTRLPYSYFNQGGEAQVGWYRKQPCTCGDGHRWDMAEVGDEKPSGSKARGAFLAVYAG